VYRARAFNRNLNPSSYGAWSNAAFSVQIEDADLSADAIKMPTGAILSLSAKNCTTASIAEVDGVKDVSGNGNHGRAYGGVEVVDSEMGKAFRQSGTRRIQCSGAELTATDRTFSCWIKKTNETNAWGQILAQNIVYNDGDDKHITGLWTSGSGIIRVCAANGVTYSNLAGILPTPNQFYHVVGVIEGNVALKLYIDGILVNSKTLNFNPQTDGLSVFIGGFSSTPEFDCFDPRVYNRALSPSEIKTLYMFPDDVAFGQLTADLIGANVIKAQNLIQSEAVITNKAQINSGVFNDILVLDSDFIDTASTATTAQSDANTALNNAITANTAISNMTNDDKLTPDEKQLTKKEWDIIVSEKPKNDTQADSFGVSKTAYGTAYSALSTYITPLLSDLTTTSDIVGTTFRAKFKDYYDARTDLLNAIATESKQVADSAKTAVDNWAVAGTNYTQIKGGVVTTGQVKSGNYAAPAVGESFAQSGSSYDLDNATITTENFYSNPTGAGIKGHIEADSGKIGQWQIDPSGQLVSGSIDTKPFGETATFGLRAYFGAPMIGYGVKPHPTSSSTFVSSYGSSLKRAALILDDIGFRVFAEGSVNAPVGNEIPMTERLAITHEGAMILNGYTTRQNRAAIGHLSFNGIVIAWANFVSNATPNQVVTLPPGIFTQAPQIALTLLTTSTVTTYFARVGSRTTTSFTCNSNVTAGVMYIAIGI
ncbi:MAG: LamG domain-containing protein, partial [Candidatus Riflebacteria bacterium]|nr:LamG domain-containing protein [Candidatus Riflebacteria bacterium]